MECRRRRPAERAGWRGWRLQRLGLDRQEQPVLLAARQAGGVDQQDRQPARRRPSAFRRAMMPASSASTRLILMPVALVKSLYSASSVEKWRRIQVQVQACPGVRGAGAQAAMVASRVRIFFMGRAWLGWVWMGSIIT